VALSELLTTSAVVDALSLASQGALAVEDSRRQ
jgi:hypothetical protein